jgi:hypothetical protein
LGSRPGIFRYPYGSRFSAAAFAGDRFGRLKFSKNGLLAQDRMLFGFGWGYRVTSSEGFSRPS